MSRTALIAAVALLLSAASCGSGEKRQPDRPQRFHAVSIDHIKPISGTFFNFQWPDERYKYMNERQANFSCDDWTLKISEMADIGIRYIVVQSVALRGHAFYPSELMPRAGLACDDPLGSVVRAAEDRGIKLFLSCEFVKNEDDDICDPRIMQARLTVMREIAARYGGSSAFFGWYFASEGDASSFFDPRYVEYVDRLAAEARTLTPGVAILIAPTRSRFVQWSDDFVRQLESLDVDIIAYQDKVAGPSHLRPINVSRTQFAEARKIHDRIPRIALWADIETFTWEGRYNSRASALVPAPFPRVLEQMAAVSPFVDGIIAFTMQGMADRPGSPAPTGPPTAAEQYREYRQFLDRDPEMLVMVDAIGGRVRHAAVGARVILPSSEDPGNERSELVDGATASIYNRKDGWIGFTDGSMDVIVDLGRTMTIDYVGVHLLADRWNKAFLPHEVSFAVSPDGTEYESIGTVEPYPWSPAEYDVRREILVAPTVGMTARYVRIVMRGTRIPDFVIPDGAAVLVSEIIVNPETGGARM
jgi:hypothetical protein